MKGVGTLWGSLSSSLSGVLVLHMFFIALSKKDSLDLLSHLLILTLSVSHNFPYFLISFSLTILMFLLEMGLSQIYRFCCDHPEFSCSYFSCILPFPCITCNLFSLLYVPVLILAYTLTWFSFSSFQVS